MSVFNFAKTNKKHNFSFIACLLIMLTLGLNLLNLHPVFAKTQEPANGSKRNNPNHTSNLSYNVRYDVGFKECTQGGQPLQAKLYVSRDGGITEEEHGQEFGGRILAAGSAYNDPRVVYSLVSDKPIVRDTQPALLFYISWDAGQTWEKRGTVKTPQVASDIANSCYLAQGVIRGMPGPAAPVTAAEVTLWAGRGIRSISYYQVAVTVDGGQTFWYNENHTDYHYTPDGLVRYHYSARENPGLELLNRDGKTWEKRQLPDYQLPATSNGNTLHHFCVVMYEFCLVNFLAQPENVSGQLFLYTSGFFPSGYSSEVREALRIWYSPDSGKSWQVIATDALNLTFSETLPLIAKAYKNATPFELDIPDLNRSQPTAVPPKGAPGGIYFPETGHNLYGTFKNYWEANGGLELFGYPLTEQFYEKNPADGKFYIVQYFERNRFEYHPELAGTKHEVLLGLLGQQLTTKQRSQGNGAFNYFPDLKYAKNVYFPQTGHNLRNAFKTHWETNGGLAIFGYPISEEFEEVNPDDNKTYVVQYFERNRFEWHPENEGTKYVVQLGLLGKTLLQEKGWLAVR